MVVADRRLIASSGNAGAALAAYASVAGLSCVVFTTASAPLAMKAQMLAYGAKLLALPSSEDRWTVLQAAVDKYGWYAATSALDTPIGSNPYAVEAYKTLAYEVWEQMGREGPDVMPGRRSPRASARDSIASAIRSL